MMTNDELQGVVPDPNPLIKCGGCGENYRYEEYWKERYIENDGRPEYEPKKWRCDECQQCGITKRRT